ncbi:MAG: hypothetical protein V3U80_10875 [Flavobacteriaceae bacterium]
MKHLLKITIALFITSLFFASCETTEEVEMDRNAKPVVNFESSTVTVTEDGTAMITIETATPISKPIIFKLVQVGGNAVDGEDYSFGSNYSEADYGPIGGKVVIPAYATSGSVAIEGVTDFMIDNKSAVFQLESMESMNGIKGAGDKVTVTIADFTSDDLTINLHWTTTDHDACDQDLDLYLGNAGNADLAHSWNDCPESLTLLSTDADDVYFISVDLWAPSDFTQGAPGDVPYDTTWELEVGQVGISSQTFAGTTNDSHYLNWSGFGAFGGDGFHSNVIQITKTGSTYVIQ